MFGFFKFLRCGTNMRFFVNVACAVDPELDEKLAEEVVKFSLLMAKRTPQWKHPVFDWKTQSFMWLASGIETTIKLTIEEDNTLIGRVKAFKLKRLYFVLMNIANKKPSLKVNECALIAVEEGYQNLTF